MTVIPVVAVEMIFPLWLAPFRLLMPTPLGLLGEP